VAPRARLRNRPSRPIVSRIDREPRGAMTSPDDPARASPPRQPRGLALTRSAFDAALFDLDGVLTRTDLLHRAAWKETFDGLLATRATRPGEPSRPFEEEDYLRHVDGRRRLDGVRGFLASRGIRLPEGDPSDAPGAPTAYGVASRKNERFLALLREQGVEVIGPAVSLVRAAREAGIRTAVVSASQSCRAVLEAAGLVDLFDARVDGVERSRLGLAGKPAPDLFLEAARRLATAPARTVVFEDAIAGVEAARAGGFGLVVGVAGDRPPDALLLAGADVVVRDLGAIHVDGGGRT